MRQKTYLTPEAQWLRSVELFLTSVPPPEPEYDEDGYGHVWYLGQIVSPHRLFVPGDVVIIHRNNGTFRCPIWSVSSKGYAVKGYYMSYLHSRLIHPRSGGEGNSRSFQRGPLKAIEAPDDLICRRPDDPALRRYVVETLRAGDAAVG